MIEKHEIKGIAHTKGLSKVSIVGKIKDLHNIIEEVSLKGNNIQTINHNLREDGTMDLSCIVKSEYYEGTKDIFKSVVGGRVSYKTNLGRVSIVGVGVKARGVAAKVFKLLSDNDINIEMVSSTEIKISCIVEEKELEKATNILHSALIK